MSLNTGHYRNIFGTCSSIIFLVALTIYLYYLIVDYSDPDLIKRDLSKKIWIYGMFLLMILGFFLSSYCVIK